jgi:hypothetical protein
MAEEYKSKMSKEEQLELSRKLEIGLQASYEAMLRRKALLGQMVVYADASGHPVTIPAKEMLEKYLAEKK